MNINQFMQLVQSQGNPQQMVMMMLENQGAKNPMFSNLLQMAKKNDTKAIEQFGNTVSNNAALAQLLSGNIDKAASILDNVADKNADTYYLSAICAARQDNLAKVCESLKAVAGICKTKAAGAATDMEFAKFWLLDEFKAAIQ